MTRRRILMPAVTVAEWGGLHEWVAECSQWLTAAGHHVTVVGGGSRFAAAVRGAGAEFIPVSNWRAWQLDFSRVEDAHAVGPFDVVFTHGPQARALGMSLAAAHGLPLYVMIHGAYHDYAFEWYEKVRRFIVASPSLSDYLVDVAKVPADLVRVVPNGLPAGVEALPLVPLDEKLADGRGSITTASRLDHDKVRQIPIALEVIRACAQARPDVTWQLDVYGDGLMRSHFERELRGGLEAVPNSELRMHGWVEPEQIPLTMSQSVVGIVAGLGGMRAIATGTLCVAVGARDSLGVQYGRNLAAGIYSNFGDHGSQNFRPARIGSDVHDLVADSARYDATMGDVRRQMLRLRSVGVVRNALFEALEL